MIKKIKEFYYKHELNFYLSILGFFLMGTAHVVLTILEFTWLSLNYALFCFLMLISRIIIWSLTKKNKISNIYAISAILLFLIIIPLAVTMVMTILKKNAPNYLYEYFIYAYALYAFIKISVSIKNLIKYKNENDEQRILAWFSLVASLFTLFMLEFSMIRIFTKTDASSLYILEMFFQGIIIAIVITLIIYFIRENVKKNRANNNQK